MRWCDDWLLLPQRIALHEPSATAVIADVHLGYSAARQRQGDAIPSRTVAEEMQPLADAARLADIRSVIVAGDLFERGFDADLFAQFLAVLDRLDIVFTGLVPGNHDRGVEAAGGSLPLHASGYDLAGWHIVHGDGPLETERIIAGHWHPAVRWQRRKLPCFLAKRHRLILPAFSLDAAGVELNWPDWDSYPVCGDIVAFVASDGKQKTPGRRVVPPRGKRSR